MESIPYIDRVSGQLKFEKVYGGKAIALFYGKSSFSRLLAFIFLPLITGNTLFSRFYGWLQKRPSSKKKIAPFVKNYDVDINEFLLPTEAYQSFNDFFIRELKPEARPITQGKSRAIIPADGRYYFFQEIDKTDGFIVKGKKFTLTSLLKDKELAKRYAKGSMVLARLCPSDYHRFHFPCDCIPHESKLINGYLYSVNPIAVKQNIDIFTENKRMVCELDSQEFGKVMYVEVGATNVGSIHETYTSGKKYSKGNEKGYFSFGGSALVILFEPGRIVFDKDLIEANSKGYEVRCLMGQSLGNGR